MLTDDIYKNNFDNLVCDLIVCKLGGTDTSRNTIITALSHLAKNAKSRQKVRNEISQILIKNDVKDILDLSYEKLRYEGGMVYLDHIINESLRF